MTTKNKSRKPAPRVPNEVTASIEPVKEDDVNADQFISTSMLGEIRRRQRRKPKDTPVG
ncbi:hypothetical protein [Budvicia aquatica]|uniref:Uncharacterized protein n=1 Tax=Budvicia aquatica TaxID=82979 RepID=A0A2C6CR85_9GAMM|nr:hypothetical protein [Budvicia aquatica]PHI29189.1 hypothetical protein CRN84_07570 [Budvicia aquatica]VFS47384.1 Uncharacterised protein [Budvicia aquatica]